MDTQLAQTAAARKERLIALRRRKEAHDKGDSSNGSTHFTFKQRNFDPETRQARKREVGEGGDDTVEKAVEGLAEEIVAEDEERRAEELVSLCQGKDEEEGGAEGVEEMEAVPRAGVGGDRTTDGERIGGMRPWRIQEGAVWMGKRHMLIYQDLFNIQPRRPNWDLKRDMTARMAKLERRTNESIAIILRQRLREQRGSNNQVDLVAGISAAQAEGDRAVAEDDEDDE